MYTNEQKMKAVELYVKYNHRATQVTRELGYPHPHLLSRWYKEYLQNGTFRTKYERQNKYTEEQKQYALQYYQSHGCCAAQTMRDLGYPSAFILRKWINEAYPDRKKCCASGGKMIKCSQEKKEKAVIDLCARNGSAKKVAKNHGVSLDQFSNQEKAEVINVLRNKYQLKVLLKALKIAKSSYCYQNQILHSPDKY